MKPTPVSAYRKWDDLNEFQREIEWRKCAADKEYFARNYFTIKTPEKGRQFLELRDAQRETLQVWNTTRNSITLKARQIGFSTLAALDALHDLMFRPDTEIITLSRNGREARKQLKDRIKYAWNDLPPLMQERAGKVVTDTIETFALDNGSIIQSLPANNPARGWSAYKIFVDEGAFFEDFDAAWAAIEAAGDVGGRIHILSTANGVGNLFHSLFMNAYTGASGWAWIFFPWSASGHDQAWYETKKRATPEWQLHQEYPSSIEEAFIKSGRPVFDVDAFEGIDEGPAIARGYILSEGFAKQSFRTDPDGELQLWELPDRECRYVIGADVAEGLEHGDFSVAVVINTRSGRVVAKWRGHVAPDEFGRDVLAPLGYYFRKALIGVEANNHGISTIDALRAARYPNQYRRRSIEKRFAAPTEKHGWRTDVASKRLLVDELRQSLRDGDVLVHDSEMVAELRTFVRSYPKVGGGAPKLHGSPFDDQVMALGITVQMRKHFWTLDDLEPEDITGTFAELEARLDAKNNYSEEWVI